VIYVDESYDEAAHRHNVSSEKYTAFQMVDGRIKSLPIGSTTDRENGILYWQPGPGFIGKFRFLFIRKNPSGDMSQKMVNIRIVPR
jgi:hypothetical protein